MQRTFPFHGDLQKEFDALMEYDEDVLYSTAAQGNLSTPALAALISHEKAEFRLLGVIGVAASATTLADTLLHYRQSNDVRGLSDAADMLVQLGTLVTAPPRMGEASLYSGADAALDIASVVSSLSTGPGAAPISFGVLLRRIGITALRSLGRKGAHKTINDSLKEEVKMDTHVNGYAWDSLFINCTTPRQGISSDGGLLAAFLADQLGPLRSKLPWSPLRLDDASVPLVVSAASVSYPSENWLIAITSGGSANVPCVPALLVPAIGSVIANSRASERTVMAKKLRNLMFAAGSTDLGDPFSFGAYALQLAVLGESWLRLGGLPSAFPILTYLEERAEHTGVVGMRGAVDIAASLCAVPGQTRSRSHFPPLVDIIRQGELILSRDKASRALFTTDYSAEDLRDLESVRELIHKDGQLKDRPFLSISKYSNLLRNTREFNGYKGQPDTGGPVEEDDDD